MPFGPNKEAYLVTSPLYGIGCGSGLQVQPTNITTATAHINAANFFIVQLLFEVKKSRNDSRIIPIIYKEKTDFLMTCSTKAATKTSIWLLCDAKVS